MGRTFIPKEFEEKYSGLLEDDAEEFFWFCRTKIPKSIWANSLKIRPGMLEKDLGKKGWKLEKLFHENAYGLEGAERPGQSDEYRQGLFNLQEKSSMLPAIVLAPEKNDLALDAAAAPGNKTLQLSCLMEGTGRIIAVEKNVQRFKSLRFNAKKFGMKNVIAKRMDLLDARKKNLFDRVLLDAPCSSEGLVRKDFDALKNWSQKLVEGKAELQKKLLEKSMGLLKKGGTLVYSTCSLSPEENEGVVQSALGNGKAELEEIFVRDFRTRPGLAEYNGTAYEPSMKKCARIYPQDNNSQAFFIAKLNKTAA